MKKLILISCILSLMISCDNKEPATDSLVKVGSTTIVKAQLDSYDKAHSLYPTALSDFFPGNKSNITAIIETEILSSKAAHLKSSHISSKDWQWKEQYFPAQVFVMDYLPNTLGFSETELKGYYDSNKEEFKQTIELDTTGRDSTYYQSFEEVQKSIAEKLFLKKYPPDSAFFARFSEESVDTNTINDEWLTFKLSDIPEFFMRVYFELEYGKKYPDSLSEVFGPGKIITPEDMEVILTWVPEERREYYESEEAKRELVEWLLKWKLFSIQAKKLNLLNTPQAKSLLEWALKIDLANTYVESELIPKLEDNFSIDTATALFAMYDDGSTPGSTISASDISAKITQLHNEYKKVRLDSLLISLRSKTGITFLQSDFRDDRDSDPSELIHKADSLRDTGMVADAENIYTTLSQDFLSFSEGKKALLELAKLQTDQQLYQTAIKNYRKHLIFSSNNEKQCNTFFMIGFIYDEHLGRPEQAEVNYKWILKNAPDCELADDAEFMLLHLDEPMSSVEELRAEALRQGRKIESFGE